jgi:hypothetical protein
VTNLELLTSAFRKVGMIDENQSPSAEQGVIGLQLLNQLLAAWGESSITFPSWFTQSDLSATLPLPDWSERAVTASLAIEIAGEYERPVSDALATVASNSFDALLRKRVLQAIKPVDPSVPMSEAGSGYYDITQ